jgi:hypothetical protein
MLLVLLIYGPFIVKNVEEGLFHALMNNRIILVFEEQFDHKLEVLIFLHSLEDFIAWKAQRQV